MWKHGRSKLCPVSLGLAIGLTCGLAMFIWALWVMYYGPTPMMAEYHLPTPTYKDAGWLFLGGLLKGFVFGFFVALFYDLITCCCKKGGVCGVCSGKTGSCNCSGNCNCSCACCSGKKDTTVKTNVYPKQ